MLRACRRAQPLTRASIRRAIPGRSRKITTAAKAAANQMALNTITCTTPVNRPRRSATMAFRATRYGFTSWSGKTGELDYRIPFFLGEETNVSNLWPETGPIPNRKDALECYVRDRICVKATIPVRTAVGIFLADWVTYSRRYGL